MAEEKSKQEALLDSLRDRLDEQTAQIGELSRGLKQGLSGLPSELPTPEFRNPLSKTQIFGSSFLQALNTSAGIGGFQNRVPQALATNEQARQAFETQKAAIDRFNLQTRRSNLLQSLGIDQGKLETMRRARDETRQIMDEIAVKSAFGITDDEYNTQLIRFGPTWRDMKEEAKESGERIPPDILDGPFGAAAMSFLGANTKPDAIEKLDKLNDSLLKVYEQRQADRDLNREIKTNREQRLTASEARTRAGDVLEIRTEMAQLEETLAETLRKLAPNMLERGIANFTNFIGLTDKDPSEITDEELNTLITTAGGQMLGQREMTSLRKVLQDLHSRRVAIQDIDSELINSGFRLDDFIGGTPGLSPEVKGETKAERFRSRLR